MAWGIRRIAAAFAGRPLLVAAVIVPASVFVVVGAFDYRREHQEVCSQVLATSTALAEHAQTVIETTDLVLARLLDRMAGMDWGTIRASGELRQFLDMVKEGLPQLGSVFLVSPDGSEVISTRSNPNGARPDVSDREYFVAARKGGAGVFVSAPFASRLDQRFGFAATQARLTAGRFDGVVGVTVSPDYFRDFYAQVVDSPGEVTATFVRADGVILARYPDHGSSPGRLPPDSVFVRSVAAGGLTGLFEGRSAIDGRWRVGSYRRLRNQPLFVSYSADASTYLRPWLIDLGFTGAFSVTLAAALLLIERVQRRRAAAEKRTTAALLQEVERRREAELALEQLQKMEALGRLSGGIAHDFNNLLTAILGPLEIASKRTTDERVQRLLGGAMQAAQRGAKLTAQMLAVARKREIAPATLDPNALIRNLGELIGRTIGPMVELAYELDPSATPVSADPIQLEMALVNLCVNARDAMPRGGTVLLRTRLATLAAPPPGGPGLAAGPYVEISVTDTGEGMTEEVQARALEPFFTTKEPGKGTGLGLSTTYGFVRSASGAVSISSRPGAGTTVTLALPRVQAPLSPAPEPDVARTAQAYDVLLVDDDNAVRLATREMLEEAGHSVIETSNGPEALRCLGAGRRIDLLVTDFAMPGMDGAQLAAAARAGEPGLPILFVTGYAKGDVLSGWEQDGAHVLHKPFTAAQLARAVADAVAGRQPVSAPGR